MINSIRYELGKKVFLNIKDRISIEMFCIFIRKNDERKVLFPFLKYSLKLNMKSRILLLMFLILCMIVVSLFSCVFLLISHNFWAFFIFAFSLMLNVVFIQFLSVQVGLIHIFHIFYNNDDKHFSNREMYCYKPLYEFSDSDGFWAGIVKWFNKRMMIYKTLFKDNDQYIPNILEIALINEIIKKMDSMADNMIELNDGKSMKCIESTFYWVKENKKYLELYSSEFVKEFET